MGDLDRIYADLRKSWHSDWMGLTRVLHECQLALFHPDSQMQSSAIQMLDTAHQVTKAIELDSEELEEPSYHNRLHVADALVGLTTLMNLQVQLDRASHTDWLSCMLLAVSAHDFKHPGGANSTPHDIESRSLTLLAPILESSAIDRHWLSIVQSLILRTDPLDVPHNHELVKNTKFQWTVDWACVLLNEADILASASSIHGPSLSEALSFEWKKVNHPLHQVVATPSGRRQFLKSILFTSPASRQLGAMKNLELQLTS